jgi:ketosteroid isomerase-like protein
VAGRVFRLDSHALGENVDRLRRDGDWAFERYTYKSTDTDKKSGAVTTDTGKGINIFRRGSDGRWRVAIDGWSSDRPAGR